MLYNINPFKEEPYRLINFLITNKNLVDITLSLHKEITLSLHKENSNIVSEFIEVGFKQAIVNNSLENLKFYTNLQLFNFDKHKQEHKGLFKQMILKENDAFVIKDFIFGRFLEIAMENKPQNKKIINFIIKTGTEFQINDDLFNVLIQNRKQQTNKDMIVGDIHMSEIPVEIKKSMKLKIK